MFGIYRSTLNAYEGVTVREMHNDLDSWPSVVLLKQCYIAHVLKVKILCENMFLVNVSLVCHFCPKSIKLKKWYICSCNKLIFSECQAHLL